MAHAPRHLQFARLALVAILWAALGSWGSVVEAAGSRHNDSHACCDRPTASACGCCPTTPTRLAATRLALTTGPGSSHVDAAPCSCRSTNPEAPAPKPAPRSTQSRTDQGRVDLPGQAAHASTPSSLAADLAALPASPARTLLLRTSRFRC